jgi:hypothetical protein
MENTTRPQKPQKRASAQHFVAGVFLLVDPIVYCVVAYLLKEKTGYQPATTLFEEDTLMRALQYFFYFSGLAFFFFSDLFVKLLARIAEKTMSSGRYKGSTADMASLMMMAILDYIGISGFIGFLISGNLTWVYLFAALSFLAKIRYFPGKTHGSGKEPTNF